VHVKSQIRKEIKRYIKNQVPDDQLVVILHTSETAGEFNWIHSREFRYHGTMYDIVSVNVITNNITEYHCITDHQETVLFKNLNKYVNSSMNSHKANSKAVNLLSLLMASLYFESGREQVPVFSMSIVNWREIPVLYQSPYIGLNLPPPELLVA
jgi:hypothetical protein